MLKTYTCVACESCGDYHNESSGAYVRIDGHPDKGGMSIFAGFVSNSPEGTKAYCRKLNCLEAALEPLVGYDADYERIEERQRAFAFANVDKPILMSPGPVVSPGVTNGFIPDNLPFPNNTGIATGWVDGEGPSPDDQKSVTQ